MLIFLHIECAVVVPAESYCELETLEAVEVSAAVGTVSHCCITVRYKLVVVRAESLPGIIGRLVQDDDHEGTHEEGCITLLGVVKGSIMVDLVVLVLLVIHELLQLFAKQMDLSEIQWPKVCKERLVHQIIVNAEVEGVLTGLRRVLIADPVETPRNDLDGLI